MGQVNTHFNVNPSYKCVPQHYWMVLKNRLMSIYNLHLIFSGFGCCSTRACSDRLRTTFDWLTRVISRHNFAIDVQFNIFMSWWMYWKGNFLSIRSNNYRIVTFHRQRTVILNRSKIKKQRNYCRFMSINCSKSAKRCSSAFFALCLSLLDDLESKSEREKAGEIVNTPDLHSCYFCRFSLFCP